MKYIAFIFLILFSITLTFADSFYPTTISGLTAEVTLGGGGTISNLKSKEEVKFQTLTFQESPYQGVEVIKEELTINGKALKPTYFFDEYNNKYVNFTITENGDFNYILVARVTTQSLINPVSDYTLPTDSNGPQALFTKESKNVESNSTELLTLQKNKLYKTNYVDTINDAIFWTNSYIEYATGSDFSTYYLAQRTAIQTLMDKKGVCDEFANLAAGILRAKKIPTRMSIGVTFDGTDWGNHAWIETYHTKLGWIPSDPTFREAGFVDGTHLQIAHFRDVTESLAKAIYPASAQVSFHTTTLPEVKILSKQYFSAVKLSLKDTSLKSKQWNTIRATITNNTDGVLEAPIEIKQNYKELIIEQTTHSLSLSAHETKEFTFKVYPNIDLASDQIAKGKVTIHSLSEPYESEIVINPANEKDEYQFTIDDITPIATTSGLKVKIQVTNYSKTPQFITITLKDSNKEYTTTDTIAGFTTQTLDKLVPMDDYGYTVTIQTNIETITQKIYLEKQKVTVAPEQVKETKVIQKVDITSSKNIIDTLLQNPDIVIISLLVGFSTILLGVFLVRKQYV